MKTHKVGMAVGFFVAFWHVVWELLVFTGLAQSLMDFKLSMHSLNNPFTVGEFDLGMAIGLIIMSYVIGYIVGSIFASIYNKFNR